MANEFIAKKGLTVASGSFSVTGSTVLYSSGSTVLDIQGSQGQLFSVVDELSGSLMSVNDISGLPILEVFSDDKVEMGTYGAPGLVVSGSSFYGTGSIEGTASFALSASWAPASPTASYVNPLNQDVQITGSVIISGSLSNAINLSVPNGSSIFKEINSLTTTGNVTGYWSGLGDESYHWKFSPGLASGLSVLGAGYDRTQPGYSGSGYIALASSYDKSGISFSNGNDFVIVSQPYQGYWTANDLDFNETTSYLKLFGSTQNMAIGSSTDSGARLTVRGSGTTSSTTTLLVENSNGDGALTVNDGGNVLIGTTTDSGEKLQISGSVKIEGSGSTLFDIQGSAGQLFAVTDGFDDPLFSVNTVSGIPAMELNSDNTGFIGKFSSPAVEIVDSGSQANVSGSFDGIFSGSADFSGVSVNGTAGWSGIINIPTNPPITIDVQNGIITNVI